MTSRTAPPSPPKALPPDPARGGLRAKLLAARNELADREARSRVLSDRLLRWLRTMPLQRLAFYWPTRGEPDVTAAITTWLAEDPARSAALPVTVGQLLEFARWHPRMPMKARGATQGKIARSRLKRAVDPGKVAAFNCGNEDASGWRPPLPTARHHGHATACEAFYLLPEPLCAVARPDRNADGRDRRRSALRCLRH